MKLNYTTRNGRMNVEFEGNQKELWEQIADFQEIFEETVCAKCQSENIKFQVRNQDDNKYYELVCKDCGARLAFGAHKKGDGLFPKRKDAEGNYKGKFGWVKWNKETNKEE